MPISEGIRGLKTYRGNYSFAIDGGGTGTIVLRSEDGPIPNGAVIMGGYIDVTTACLSGTGTMALNSEGAGDILAAVGQAGFTLGRKSIIPAFTGATAIKTTAPRSPAVTIATAAFTAGVFDLVIVYR